MTSFLVLLLAYTLSQFYRSFLAVVSADLTRDLGLDPAGLGTLSATWFAAFAFAQFPVGYTLDRHGPRRTIALGMIAAIAGAALLASATGFAGAVAAMALIGIGCSPIYMGSLYIIARERPHQFALLSATMLGIGSIGNLLGATPLVLAAEWFGWRSAMLAIAVATAVSTAAVWLVVRDPPRVVAGAGESDGLVAGLIGVLRLRALWLLFPLALVSYAVIIATRSVWVAPFLTSSYGLAPEPLGNAVLVFGLAMSLGALATGAATRWLGAKTITVGGNVVAVLGFLALGAGLADGVATAVALLAAIGFFGMTYAVLMEHGRAFMPPHLIGRGITFLNFAFIGGAGLVQWIAGHLVKAWLDAGIPAPAAYRQLFMGFGIVLLGAMVVYLFAPAKAPGQADRASA